MTMIRRHFSQFISIFSLLFIAATASAGLPFFGTKAKVTSGQDSAGIQEKQAEAYDGPKARIAVARFTDKTGKGWWTGQIGDGMADQLTTLLFNTNRFIVLERQTVGDVLGEQDLGASGRVRRETAAPIGEIEGAELLVVAAVTEFEGAASGGRGRLGGFNNRFLGAITGAFKKAHMAIDLRIIDSRTSRVVAAASVEGSSGSVDLGVVSRYFGDSGALVGALGGWKNTPTEKALRVVIAEAVDFVVTKTPQQYYRHGGSVTVRQPQSPSASSASPGLTRSVVRQMQSMLASLGYDVGTPDGLAGKKTSTAISQFQSDNGLEITGSFNPPTMKKIRELTGL